MSADILERLDFMLISRRSDEDAIIRDARAEIGRLRGELDSLRGWFDASRAPSNMSDDHDDAAGDDADDIAPAEAKAPAPAMPNGVEAAEVARMLSAYAGTTTAHAKGDTVKAGSFAVAIARAADNRDAAGVTDERGRPMTYWGGTPAAVPAGEAVAYSVVQVGNRGAAYDPPNTHRAFTYEHQPGNIDASRLGRATAAAALASAGDGIDRGLSLLKELQALGFGVFQIGPPAPVQAAPQEGEAKRLIGWRTDGYTMETDDRNVALNWSGNLRVLPIFEGDPNTRMAAHSSACELGAVRERELLGIIEGLLQQIDRETCTHEETHRGGAIWTICDGCGQQWADDRGGFVPHSDSEAVTLARAALQHRGDSRGGEG